MSAPEYTIDDERRFQDWYDDPCSSASSLLTSDRMDAVQVGFQAGWDAAKTEMARGAAETRRNEGTESELREAAEQLSRSQKGRHAMQHVLAWLDEDGLSLDAENQQAVLTLLDGAWGSFAGTARDLMRAVVEAHCEHGIRDGEYCAACNREYKRAARANGYDS